MLTVVMLTHRIPPITGDDDCPDAELVDESIETVTFRELVSLMRNYQQPSSWPCSGAPNEWLSAWPESDYYTGSTIEKSLHYALQNPARNERYWRKAMRVAGVPGIR
jgi:hypothetical protein